VDLLAHGRPADLAGSLPEAHRLIVTCRHKAEGGRFCGAFEQQRAWLEAALDAGVEAVDLEACASDRLWSALAARGAERLVASVHRFGQDAAEPAAMAQAWDRLAHRPARTLKLAVEVTDVTELGPLRDLPVPPGRQAVRVGMGLAGQVGRACPRAMASAWTYVAAPGTRGTAPGQLDWTALSRFVRGAQDPGLLVLLGGDSVDRSPGPAVYTPLAAEQGLPLLYLPAPTADPAGALTLLSELGLQGASVTMPHKEALGEVATPQGFAAQVGAINTLFRAPGDDAWWGDNTDGLGVLGALRSALPAPAERASEPAGLAGRRVLVLGTGGAARAACFALAGAGCRVEVTGRRPRAAAALAAEAGGEPVPWEARAETPFDVLVNATPLGASCAEGRCNGPGSNPMPDHTSWAGRTALDMLLHPRDTALLKQVAAGGGLAVPGLRMWVHQGAAQWRLLTGRWVTPAQLEARAQAANRWPRQKGAAAGDLAPGEER
jgi:3-dehydroquinate dehydratase/shikimate dehydrogenase